MYCIPESEIAADKTLLSNRSLIRTPQHITKQQNSVNLRLCFSVYQIAYCGRRYPGFFCQRVWCHILLPTESLYCCNHFFAFFIRIVHCSYLQLLVSLSYGSSFLWSVVILSFSIKGLSQTGSPSFI